MKDGLKDFINVSDIEYGNISKKQTNEQIVE